MIPWIFKRARRDVWKCSERGNGREELSNYIIISKIKATSSNWRHLYKSSHIHYIFWITSDFQEKEIQIHWECRRKYAIGDAGSLTQLKWKALLDSANCCWLGIVGSRLSSLQVSKTGWKFIFLFETSPCLKAVCKWKNNISKTTAMKRTLRSI